MRQLHGQNAVVRRHDHLDYTETYEGSKPIAMPRISYASESVVSKGHLGRCEGDAPRESTSPPSRAERVARIRTRTKSSEGRMRIRWPRQSTR